MSNAASTVIPIPSEVKASNRQLRVAAYCRVATVNEFSNCDAQKNHHADKIKANKAWTMAGIFVDEGIPGTSTRNRPAFNKMIQQCKQGKIDIILTQSIATFARNTVDSLNYVRALKELGIAIIFEKENINTLEVDDETLMTMLGMFAR